MNPAKYYFDEGYHAGFAEAKALLMKREENMQCLSCGVSIIKKVMDCQKMHFCTACMPEAKQIIRVKRRHGIEDEQL